MNTSTELGIKNEKQSQHKPFTEMILAEYHQFLDIVQEQEEAILWFWKTRLYTSFPTKGLTILPVTPRVTHQKTVALPPNLPSLYTFVSY